MKVRDGELLVNKKFAVFPRTSARSLPIAGSGGPLRARRERFPARTLPMPFWQKPDP
jgi:hypothetical protein